MNRSYRSRWGHRLRWWDARGHLLLTGAEWAERLAARLRQLGIDPESL